MDVELIDKWGFGSKALENHKLASYLTSVRSYDDEYNCLTTLWDALNTFASARYLLQAEKDPADFIFQVCFHFQCNVSTSFIVLFQFLIEYCT